MSAAMTSAVGRRDGQHHRQGRSRQGLPLRARRRHGRADRPQDHGREGCCPGQKYRHGAELPAAVRDRGAESQHVRDDWAATAFSARLPPTRRGQPQLPTASPDSVRNPSIRCPKITQQPKLGPHPVRAPVWHHAPSCGHNAARWAGSSSRRQSRSRVHSCSSRYGGAVSVVRSASARRSSACSWSWMHGCRSSSRRRPASPP